MELCMHAELKTTDMVVMGETSILEGEIYIYLSPCCPRPRATPPELLRCWVRDSRFTMVRVGVGVCRVPRDRGLPDRRWGWLRQRWGGVGDGGLERMVAGEVETRLISDWGGGCVGAAPEPGEGGGGSRVCLFFFLPNPANCRKRNFGRNFTKFR